MLFDMLLYLAGKRLLGLAGDFWVSASWLAADLKVAGWQETLPCLLTNGTAKNVEQ